MIVLFWALLGTIAFSLFGYGLFWTALGRLTPARKTPAPVSMRATILIAARNEEDHIGDKIATILAQEPGPHDFDVIVVSDGSDDRTIEMVEQAAQGDDRVKAIELPRHGGKAAALNRGLIEIPHDRIVVFSDANSLLRKDALNHLLAPFADHAVGGAVGQLDIPPSGGLLSRAERLFWRYDNALKSAEDRVAGVVSAQGTLFAVRRALVRPVPTDMADDLVISLAVVDQGYRLAWAEGAVATETVTTNVGGEFGRRVRSTERGWRGLMAYRRLMNPARTGLYAVQLICHKLLRRLVAFMLPALLFVNFLVAGEGAFYSGLLTIQLAILAIAGLGLFTRWGTRLPGAAAAAIFVMGYAAILWAIVRYAFGVRSTKWSPIRR